MVKVRSNLHTLMGKHKIRSINHLSKKTGISRPTLTRIYNDDSDRIELLTIEKLCKFFGCQVGDLFYFADDEDNQ